MIADIFGQTDKKIPFYNQWNYMFDEIKYATSNPTFVVKLRDPSSN